MPHPSSNQYRFRPNFSTAAGFTLVQTLIVIGVVCALAALVFPVLGRVRERGRQVTCAGNLHQIYLAVRQYYQDETRYPPNISPLLPTSTPIIVASGAQPQRIGRSAEPPIGQGELGYLRSLDVLTCPNDDNEYNVPHSSYDTAGDPLVSVWNYRGYNESGLDYGEYQIPSEVLVNPNAPFDLYSNPVRLSLANRLAPPQTIISHCRFHRAATAGVEKPDDIYDPGLGNNSPAHDLILRLDGSVKNVDVSRFNGENPTTKWQSQNF